MIELQTWLDGNNVAHIQASCNSQILGDRINQNYLKKRLTDNENVELFGEENTMKMDDDCKVADCDACICVPRSRLPELAKRII